MAKVIGTQWDLKNFFEVDSFLKSTTIAVLLLLPFGLNFQIIAP